MGILYALLLFLFLIKTFQTQHAKILSVKDPDNIVIAFGSCNGFKGDESKDIFYRIAELRPDVWIWLGDATYLDEPHKYVYIGEEKIKQKFYEAKSDPSYIILRENTENIIGMWDDHDYGRDNADKNFPHKKIIQQLWLDFIDEPKESPRRLREGIYDSYYVGDTSKIKVILLDTRYFKDEEEGWFESSNQKDVLGHEQWEWLENELSTNTAKYVLIGSGIQILPDDRIMPEHWFQQSRNRLISLIGKYRVNGVILLSGDVHYSEIMKYPCIEHVGYDLYEFTSSGLTHHLANDTFLADQFVDVMFPKTYNTHENRYMRENFGILKFSFNNKQGVHAEIKDFFGKTVLEKKFELKSLQINPEIFNEKSACVIDSNIYVRFFGNFIDSLLAGRWYAYFLLSFCLLPILAGILFVKLAKLVVPWIQDYGKISVKKIKET